MEMRPGTRKSVQWISLVLFGVCVLAFGCRPSLDDQSVWKAEVPSPDATWIASVRTVQNGGFGSASIYTVVYLNHSGVSRSPTEVLTFDCEGPVPRPYVLDNGANAGGTIELTMTWVNPSHLEVTYNGHKGKLEFQVAKIYGIDISVRDASFPTFTDFPVSEVFHGEPARPSFKTPRTRLFKTTILNAAEGGPDFAGRFTVAQWGCGSDCISFAVVDMKTGEVYDEPFAFLTSLPGKDDFAGDPGNALSYKLDSRLLILRGCPDDSDNCSTFFFEWTGERFVLIRKVPGVPQ